MTNYALIGDVGGTKVTMAVVAVPSLLRGLSLDRYLESDIVTQETARHSATALSDQIIEIGKELARSKRISVIALATPGPIINGEIVGSPNMGAERIPVALPLFLEFNAEIYHGNDADTATLGMGGLEQEVLNQVTMCVSTGIGGGFIASGRLVRTNVEPGHFKVGYRLKDPLLGTVYCGCGDEQCWEAHSSSTGVGNKAGQYLVLHPDHETLIISLLLNEESPLSLNDTPQLDVTPGPQNPIRGEHIYSAAAMGDKLAQRLVDEAAQANIYGFGEMISGYGPEKINVFGGMALAQYDRVIGPVIQALPPVGQRAKPYSLNPVPNIEPVPDPRIVLVGAIVASYNLVNRIRNY